MKGSVARFHGDFWQVFVQFTVYKLQCLCWYFRPKKCRENNFDTLEIDLKASGRRQVDDQLNKVINEMTLDDTDSASKVVEDDLLALMDQIQ